MFYPALLIVLTAFRVRADPKPQIPRPSNMPKLGQTPVAFGPKPAGCSNFEILVGPFSSKCLSQEFKLITFRSARGTSEPGPFGVIVGDPLVAAVSKLVPGARGYAVQVQLYFSDMFVFSVNLVCSTQQIQRQYLYRQGPMIRFSVFPRKI
jgi:hypothetical protein